MTSLFLVGIPTPEKFIFISKQLRELSHNFNLIKILKTMVMKKKICMHYKTILHEIRCWV